MPKKIIQGKRTSQRLLRLCLISLGCPKNQVDSEKALGAFRQAGFNITGEAEKADVLVINTCAFIRPAEEETIQAVLEAAQLKKKGKVRFLLVVGCWVAKYSAARLLKLVPEIDAVAKPSDINSWVEIVRDAFPELMPPGTSGAASKRFLLSGPGTAYIKVAEGCSRKCTFCLIPKLRGPLHSLPMDGIVSEAEALAQAGAQELVLVAQDTTRYGYDLYGYSALTRLLSRLAKIPEVRWLRVMYTNPDGINTTFIDCLAQEPKICKYIDFPFQHVQPKILRAMGRAGSAEQFLSLIHRLRECVPNIVLRTTLMTGFPGETEADHKAVLDFVRTAQLDRVGIFAFSRESGTTAATMPGQVHYRTSQRRLQEIMGLQLEISRSRLASCVGKEIECITEASVGKKYFLGRTRADAPEVDGKIVLQGSTGVGSIVRARITGSTDHDLQGVII